jgi:hypothetical protein
MMESVGIMKVPIYGIYNLWDIIGFFILVVYSLEVMVVGYQPSTDLVICAARPKKA